MEAIASSDCLVTAPTGSGKTWIAEQVIEKTLKKGGRAWYASPLKALTNAKFKDFGVLWGLEQVGILTGDRKQNVDAPLITGTTEILRNQLYDAMHHGQTLNTSLVILDEAHFLGDEERGVVWEEVMIYLPKRVPLLLLSATVGNARQIAKWLRSVRQKPCVVIEEKKRPVSLFPLFLHPKGTIYPLLSKEKKNHYLNKKVQKFIQDANPPQLSIPNRLPPFGSIVNLLRKYNLLPAIFFLKSRADCDAALNLCAVKNVVKGSRLDKLNIEVEKFIQGNPHLADHCQLKQLKKATVGAHHSGQLPAWKQLLEHLMTKGLLNAIFATSTVAAGVNFPARTICILNSDRFNGHEFSPLSPTEFHQMSGRAGRRGMDRIGFVLIIPGKYMDVKQVARLIHAPPEDVISQIRINFSMVLNLLLSHTPSQIEDLLEHSFADFLVKTAYKKKHVSAVPGFAPKFLDHQFLRHLSFLKKHGFVSERGRPTEDGMWAAKLRVDQPLLIAETIRQNLFPTKDPELLAAIMAVFVFEGDTDSGMENQLKPHHLGELFLHVKEALAPLSHELMKSGFEVRPFFFRPAATLYAWARGRTWSSVVKLSGMAEGRLVMLVLRTADHLRHIRSLKKPFPEIAENSRNAVQKILRPPVLVEDLTVDSIQQDQSSIFQVKPDKPSETA